MDPAKNSNWRRVSEEGKDLVSKLLVVNSRNRLSAAAALRHPWFTQDCQTVKIAVEKIEEGRRRMQQSKQAVDTSTVASGVRNLQINAQPTRNQNGKRAFPDSERFDERAPKRKITPDKCM